MDFDHIIANCVSDFVWMVRICINLIVYPYRTMREISTKHHAGIGSIIFFVFLYFILLGQIRGKGWLGFITGLVLLVLSVVFLSLLPGKETFVTRLHLYVRTWAHTLYPTLLWFYINLVLYVILPPPRTFSVWGIGFSVLYLTFSISLLVWKIILVYLSIRFSSRVQLYRIIYYFILYLAIFIPLWVFLYHLGISRIPFV